LPLWRRAIGGVVIVSSFAALSLVGCPGTGVGAACTPEDEFKEGFPGFSLDSAFIESRSFQCQTRICLVNYFQGRVSCPNGQAKPESCDDKTACKDPQEKCIPAGVILKNCDPTPCSQAGANTANCNKPDGKNIACADRICDPDNKYCRCEGAADCPAPYFCDQSAGKGLPGLCTTKVCAPENPNSEAGKKRCYVPGTAIPIAVAVCPQCAADSNRDARAPDPRAVYCSCRCGPPDSNPSSNDDNFNFCKCPDGFECAEINPNFGLGDAQLAGKYCIRNGTFVKQGDEPICGNLAVAKPDPNCKGTGK
jgi:hypothetical protein